MTAIPLAGAGGCMTLLVLAHAVVLPSSLLCFVSTRLEDEWLGQQHPGHSYQAQQEQQDLQACLPSEQEARLVHGPGVQEHGDQHVVQVGEAVGGDPLEDDEEAEVAKQAVEENHLGHKLAPCRQVVPEIAVVEEAHDDTQVHVQHTQQDAHLHLDTVEVGQLGLTAAPCRVHSKWVGLTAGELDVTTRMRAVAQVSWPSGRRLATDVASELGVTAKSHGHSKELVVQGADIHGKEGHQQDAVAAAKRHAAHIIKLRLSEAALVEDQEQGKQEHEDTMAKVAKHDSEQEGEGHDGEDSWVHLTVVGNAVRIHNGLEALGELVGPEVGGRLLVLHSQGLQYGVDLRVAMLCCLAQCL
mmetsp:Transcript_3937/g.8463  ORF Transcript_3937/g.8463 Transcript_3937/m.8463 type:complete len:356 (+) Transcript_3937:1110-2177(+)